MCGLGSNPSVYRFVKTRELARMLREWGFVFGRDEQDQLIINGGNPRLPLALIQCKMHDNLVSDLNLGSTILVLSYGCEDDL